MLAYMNASMTKYKIAKKMGVSHQAVYLWFSGKTLPNTKNLIALSKLLGVSVEKRKVDII